MIVPSKNDLRDMVNVMRDLKENEKMFGEYVKSIKKQIQLVPNLQTFLFKLLADEGLIEMFIKYYQMEG